jgi:tetratricopeptide (TPR) repeat protein
MKPAQSNQTLAQTLLSEAMGALRKGDLQNAENLLRRSIDLDPNQPDAYVRLAIAISSPWRTDEAIAFAQRALELNPGLTMAHGLLSGFYQRQGKFEDAVSSAKNAIALNPNLIPPYVDIVRCQKISPSDAELIAKLEELSRQPNRSNPDRMVLQYALGKAYDDLGQFAIAINHFDQANAIGFELFGSRHNYQPQVEERFVSSLIETFTSSNLHALVSGGSRSEAPVFIIGMIRSGTTLLDSLLTRHKLVGSVGEQKFWDNSSPTLLAEIRSSLATNAGDLPKLRVADKTYLKLIYSIDPRPRILDKFPLNFAHVGLIHAAFPRARFIHLRRNPVDTCLSIYTTEFGPGAPKFAYKKSNIVHAYRQYLRLMKHWRVVLPPNTILEIDYEALTANQEVEISKVVQFLGLSPAEHAKEQTSVREVVTPSRWQVRQPVYRSSIERWRNYQPWISPFDQLLEKPR